MAKGFVAVSGIEVGRVSEGGGQLPFLEAVFQTSLVVLAGKERPPNQESMAAIHHLRNDVARPEIVSEMKVPPNARRSARLWAYYDFYACQMGPRWADPASVRPACRRLG
jgi:hypothetical protein